MELEKEDSFFEDQEKNIYRVKEDCRVETITISAYLDELVLCNLPKLRQINLEAPVENAIIENCPKLVINRTPANHARISGCDAITWFSVDGEECEISDCKNLEELDISAFDCDYGMSVTIKDCKKLKKVCCEGREDIDLKILGCDALREFCNDGEYFPDADIEPNNTTILKTVPCSNFSLNDFGGIKQLYIGDQSIFNILDINDDEQFKNMIVDDIEMSVDCSGMEDLELVKIADGTNLYEANFSGCKNLRNLYIGSGTHCD
ncbi:MAG: hypothetical protein MJZ46_07780, partial [Bacteroidales bacterium]|nr:hypothetical protein [Bacteroidales bacterium]